MASRTVQAVVTTYIGEDGVPRVGMRGEKIKVHADSLKAFDAGEVEAGSLVPARTQVLED